MNKLQHRFTSGFNNTFKTAVYNIAPVKKLLN